MLLKTPSEVRESKESHEDESKEGLGPGSASKERANDHRAAFGRGLRRAGEESPGRGPESRLCGPPGHPRIARPGRESGLKESTEGRTDAMSDKPDKNDLCVCGHALAEHVRVIN